MSTSDALRVNKLKLSHPRRWLQMARTALPVVFIAALVGCSSATTLETWEGSPATAVNAATLKAPGAIQVSRVNGRSMTNYLMNDLALDYALLPGENQVVFTYKTIWAKAEVVDNGESKVYVIESEPQVVRFEASPNETYKFEFDVPETRRQAEQVMPAFSAAIVGADGQIVTRSANWTPSEYSSTARTPLPDGQTIDGEALSSESVSSLDRLKAVWETASDDDKKAFLRWAFE